MQRFGWCRISKLKSGRPRAFQVHKVEFISVEQNNWDLEDLKGI